MNSALEHRNTHPFTDSIVQTLRPYPSKAPRTMASQSPIVGTCRGQKIQNAAKTSVFLGLITSAVPRIHVDPLALVRLRNTSPAYGANDFIWPSCTSEPSTAQRSSCLAHDPRWVCCAKRFRSQRPAIELEPRILFRPKTNFRQTPSAAPRPTPYSGLAIPGD